jgi:hypothetical protein
LTYHLIHHDVVAAVATIVVRLLHPTYGRVASALMPRKSVSASQHPVHLQLVGKTKGKEEIKATIMGKAVVANKVKGTGLNLPQASKGQVAAQDNVRVARDSVQADRIHVQVRVAKAKEHRVRHVQL